LGRLWHVSFFNLYRLGNPLDLMILTCPECSTKYMAKDGSIGPNGRSVHCARCEAVWFVPGADPDALALEDNKAVLIAPEVQPTPSRMAEPEPKPAPYQAPAVATVGAHTLLRDKADAEKLSKRKRFIRMIWAAPLCLLIGGATGAIWKRQSIVEQQPKAATLFQSIGLGVKANGLDIQGLTSSRLVVDGEEILRVTGEIVNLTSQAKTSPLVQLRLENRSGEPVADWFVEPGTVPAGQSIKIETDYPAPPIDSVELRYRFAPDE